MKIIVFTQRVDVIASYGERRDCADQRIVEFIAACGFLPVPLPNNDDLAVRIVEQFSPAGIILTGGNSLVKYGGTAPERDATDKAMIEHAVRHRLPLYGFCRGMQSILDYFGCDLVKIQNHVAVKHDIIGIEGSDCVNSYHNEACCRLAGDELRAIMRSTDGGLEKIAHKTLPIIGTMWHPERETPFRAKDIAMVKKLMSI